MLVHRACGAHFAALIFVLCAVILLAARCYGSQQAGTRQRSLSKQLRRLWVAACSSDSAARASSAEMGALYGAIGFLESRHVDGTVSYVSYLVQPGDFLGMRYCLLHLCYTLLMKYALHCRATRLDQDTSYRRSYRDERVPQRGCGQSRTGNAQLRHLTR